MYLLIGAIFILCGMAMIIRPRFIYEITESWKSNVPGDPTPLYLFSTRFGGVMVSLVGIMSIIGFFL